MRRALIPLTVVAVALAVLWASGLPPVGGDGGGTPKGPAVRYLSLDSKRGPGDVRMAGRHVPQAMRPGSYVVLTCHGEQCSAAHKRTIVRGRVRSPTLLAAGDIAHCDSNGDEQTARIAAAYRGKVQLATLGDTVYPTGSERDFVRCYQPSWGKLSLPDRPAAGNHDYGTGSATTYFAYFGPAAGPAGRGWYSYEYGGWHVVVLNSNCGFVPGGGCGVGSEQERWLRADLAAHPARCTLAYWHHPRWSSGPHGSDPSYDAFWRDLRAAGADVVLNGHDHDYERWAPQNADGKRDPNGIREWVAGTGGSELYPIVSSYDNSQVKIAGTPGLLELTLHPTGYEWRFLPVEATAAADSGRARCH
ncbi:MAG: acid phosphatase type 7 [Thermoleophilaceae bacterium]|nr:acid phosphatase type 7 [Thermoleophilaceae bacterium]